MSYDLHIVRTTDWFDAHTNPVTKDDVESLISKDPDLSWSEDYVDMRVDNEVVRFYLIDWKGTSYFWWYKSEIRFKNPDEAAHIKLLEIAILLNANVVGDDGEHYRFITQDGGKKSIETFYPQLPSSATNQQNLPVSREPWYKFW